MKKKPGPQPAPLCKDGYATLLGGLTKLLEDARRASARSVNAVMTATYWEMGRRIVEHEQGAGWAGRNTARLCLNGCH